MVQKRVRVRCEWRAQKGKQTDERAQATHRLIPLLRGAVLGTDQRPPDRRRKDIVEIQVQLRQNADAGPTGMVYRHDRFETDLEIASDPDHSWI